MMMNQTSTIENNHGTVYKMDNQNQVFAAAFQQQNSDKDTIAVQQNDVLCGKRRTLDKHPGNLAFRAVVAEYVLAYKTTKKTSCDRALITKEIIDRIQSNGSRFLRQHQIHGHWVAMSRESIQDKVGQMIRDMVKREINRKMKDSGKTVAASASNSSMSAINSSVATTSENYCGKNVTIQHNQIKLDESVNTSSGISVWDDSPLSFSSCESIDISSISPLFLPVSPSDLTDSLFDSLPCTVLPANNDFALQQKMTQHGGVCFASDFSTGQSDIISTSLISTLANERGWSMSTQKNKTLIDFEAERPYSKSQLREASEEQLSMIDETKTRNALDNLADCTNGASIADEFLKTINETLGPITYDDIIQSNGCFIEELM